MTCEYCKEPVIKAQGQIVRFHAKCRSIGRRMMHRLRRKKL